MSNDQSSFISSSQPAELIEGNITSTIAPANVNPNELSTLDEPVLETIKRLCFFSEFRNQIGNFIFRLFQGDVHAVLRKFGHVIIPRKSLTLLQQWDLWGPLILATTLAIVLQANSTKVSSGAQFAEIFTLMVIGSFMVTVNNLILALH